MNERKIKVQFLRGKYLSGSFKKSEHSLILKYLSFQMCPVVKEKVNPMLRPRGMNL